MKLNHLNLTVTDVPATSKFLQKYFAEYCSNYSFFYICDCNGRKAIFNYEIIQYYLVVAYLSFQDGQVRLLHGIESKYTSKRLAVHLTASRFFYTLTL